MASEGTFGCCAAEKRTILHCDMNNFFASVECLHQPELAGKLVAVRSGDRGPDPGGIRPDRLSDPLSFLWANGVQYVVSRVEPIRRRKEVGSCADAIWSSRKMRLSR